tara:strand:- start:268 stop:1359 length:1092 start_codon:yes stop_codon:yes gene_type:complete
MIKFFRHIRKSLLMENKKSKPALPAGRYLKYAIGEIVLVVIGILIALQINIWNQEKNNEEKVIKILQQVQKDLLNDLQEGQYFSDWWQRDDKMLTQFFKGTKPAQYFKDNFSEFSRIGLATYRFTQNKQGYNRLNEQIDIVSSKYNDVLDKLSRLYNERSSFLLSNQIAFNNLVQEYRIYLHDNFDWMENYRSNSAEWSDVKFNYFYTSKKHRRQLGKHRAFFDRYDSQVSAFKDQSLLCYLVIRDIINDTSEFPEIIKSYGLEYSQNNMEDFLGNYGSESDSIVRNFMEIKYNVLFWSKPNQRELFSEGLILREYGKDSLGFVMSNVFPMKFVRDSTNKVTGFIGYNINDSDKSIKVIKLDE